MKVPCLTLHMEVSLAQLWQKKKHFSKNLGTVSFQSRVSLLPRPGLHYLPGGHEFMQDNWVSNLEIMGPGTGGKFVVFLGRTESLKHPFEVSCFTFTMVRDTLKSGKRPIALPKTNIAHSI